ncbi:Nephrocystin-3 [Homo sapiens] [Rhizoctonia solani]|uniref:Nephrocystin-3 [Homo sapiens] n=1 Tax=Rhizoctonia solani TaxID=456999 RepID=A0A0K6G7K0_9AGAM|nr:Nephrocystin-3 [Homo sapiens] [Rhizoctonia solani]
MAVAVLAIFILPDFPSTTSWLSPMERRLAEVRMAEDAGGEADSDTREEGAFYGLILAVKDWKVWWLALALTAQVVGLSFNAYFPTLTATLGYNDTISLLLCAPPWAFATIHVAGPLILGIIGFVITEATMHIAGRYIALFLMTQSYAGFIVLYAWCSNSIPRPPSKRAVALALVNASQLGNIAGSRLDNGEEVERMQERHDAMEEAAELGGRAMSGHGEGKPRGLNILCIDGGGARGLSSLVVLQEVMHRLEALEGDSAKLKPADYFDVIAGSGTGGLSACMLGRLRMPLDLVIEEYANLIREVFADKKIIRTSGASAYKGSKLQEALQRIISKFSKDGEMMEGGNTSEDCKTIIFAMSKHNMNAALPIMFRSYKVAANRGPNCTILDALRATMAHPSLFKDIEIEEHAVRQSFISGDIGCSNPTAHVLAEAKRIYPGRHVSCILSIGAGHARTINIPDYNISDQVFCTQDLVAMKNMATDSERVAEEMAIRFAETKGVYFRLNVDQGIQGMKAGDWEKLGDVKAHTTAYLGKIHTDQKVEELVRAIKEQGNALEIESIDGRIQQRHQVRRARLKKCPAPTPVYTGREDEAKQIAECILEKGDYGRPICVIYGLGGSGKTQLALKVVEQTREEWDEVLYIDGTSNEAIENSMKGFAEARNIGHTYQPVIDWLGSYSERWLMIIDNVDEPSVCAKLDSYFPAGTNGSILITTRLIDLAFLARGTGSACHLSPGMKPEESLALLIKVARLVNQHTPDHEAEMKEGMALVEDFGYLALAIVHAGAYIAHSPGLNISKYRKIFRSKRRVLEEYRKLVVPVDKYAKTVYTTWEMCYDLLKEDSRPLLWLMAFFHNSIIEEIFERATISLARDPLARVFLLPPADIVTDAHGHLKRYLARFLDSIGNWDSLQFLSVMNEVALYSLIDFDRMNDAYSIHVLVQDWARTKIEQEPGLAFECAATVLSFSIGFDASSESRYDSRSFMVGLEMHINCLLSHEQPISQARDYHRQFAKVYRELKQWERVETLQYRFYQEMGRARGAKHIYTLGCMIDLASTYLNQNRLPEAEELQTKVLIIQKEVLGHDHPLTQTSVNNLASIYQKQGRLDEAQKLQLGGVYSSFQPWSRKSNLMLEREFLNMLKSKGNLALSLSIQGRLEEAEVLQLEVLNAYRNKFTEEHPDTISSILNLASTYYKKESWDESKKLCLRAAELQTKMSGVADSDTLKSIAQLAIIYSERDQWIDAETLQQFVVDSYRQTQGAENPDTLNAMAELAVTHSKKGCWDKAEALQKHVIDSYKQASRTPDPEMIMILAELGVTYSMQGRQNEAALVHDRAKKCCKQVLDEMNPVAHITMTRHGMLYLKLLGNTSSNMDTDTRIAIVAGILVELEECSWLSNLLGPTQLLALVTVLALHTYHLYKEDAIMEPFRWFDYCKIFGDICLTNYMCIFTMLEYLGGVPGLFVANGAYSGLGNVCHGSLIE